MSSDQLTNLAAMAIAFTVALIPAGFFLMIIADKWRRPAVRAQGVPEKAGFLAELSSIAFVVAGALATTGWIWLPRVLRALWCLASVAFLVWVSQLYEHDGMGGRASVEGVITLLCVMTCPMGTVVFGAYWASPSHDNVALYSRAELAMLGSAMCAAGYYQWFRLVPRLVAWVEGRR
jgi:hypothetical protein